MEGVHRGDSNINLNLHNDDNDNDSDYGNEDNQLFFSLSKLKNLARKKIASSKFKNIQTEMLYQRYLLRMNQNNATYIVWLLSALIAILSVIHMKFFVDRWNKSIECSNKNATKDMDDAFALNDLFANLTMEETNNTLINDTASPDLFTSSSPMNCENFDELLSANIIQFSLLGVCSMLYIILLLCLYKRKINEIYLFHVSYAIIISLIIIDISFSITNMSE